MPAPHAHRRHRFRALGVALLLVALSTAASAQQLTVSAAASLTDAFKAIGAAFEARRPGVTVRFNFAASGVLLQQIQQGAPVDLFASADQETMARGIAQQLLVADTKRDFAANSLVLVVPAQDGPAVRTLADLTGSGIRRIAIGKLASVPVGRYTKQALEAANLWTALEPRLVYGDSVRQVLDYVARGEAEAGFVYRTDARIAGDKVKVVQAVGGHAPVRYPLAIVADSRQQELARAFADALLAPEGQALLATFGFQAP